MDLHRLGRDRHRRLGREELRHRGFLRVRPALVLQARGAQREQARGLDRDGHVRELPLRALELDQGLAEGATVTRVGERVFERGPRDPDRLRGDADAAAVERLHRDLEALVLGTDRKSVV